MRSENVGPITINNFLEPFGSAAAALDTLPDLIRHGGAKRNKIAPLSAARQKYETIQAAGVNLVARGEDRYPHLLAQVEDAPRSLLVRGFVRILNTKPLTFSGTAMPLLIGFGSPKILPPILGSLDFSRCRAWPAASILRRTKDPSHPGRSQSSREVRIPCIRERTKPSMTL